MASRHETITWWGREVESPHVEESPAVKTLDESTFEAFYARTSRSLWAYLRRLSGNSQTAEDVHQEAYIRYLNHPCPSHEEKKQNAYLFRIASNLLRDQWRRQERERSWLQRLFTPSQAEAPKFTLELDLDRVLSELKPRQRALLWLAYAEEYNHQEIAEILDLKPASVKVLLFRARRRMSKLLAESESPLEVQDTNQSRVPKGESNED